MSELTLAQTFQRARRCHLSGQLEEAEQLYRAILQVQPNHPEANHHLGLLFSQQLADRLREAEAIYKSIVESQENRSSAPIGSNSGSLHGMSNHSLPISECSKLNERDRSVCAKVELNETSPSDPFDLASRTDARPTIRVLHHMARSGGTIISRCLGCMKDVVLLSEIHPSASRLAQQYGVQFDPLHQAQNWFDLFTSGESAELRNSNQSYPQIIKIIEQRVRDHGRILVLRDWSHLDFTGVPFVANPAYRLGQIDALKNDFQVVHVATVRHPIAQWSSLSKLSIISGKLTTEQFLLGYLEFAKCAREMGFLRYEDFLSHPQSWMQELCRRLELPFDHEFEQKWTSYTKITGDTAKEKLSIKVIMRSANAVPDALLEEFSRISEYGQAVDILGYDHSHTEAAASSALTEPANSAAFAQPWETLFDKIVVISLSESKERRCYIEKHLPSIGISSFEFFDAISASDPEVTSAYQRGEVLKFPPCFRCGKIDCGDPNCNNFLVPQQVATFITYLRLWKWIGEGNAERILVLEDDISFHPHTESVLNWLVKEVQEGRVPFRAGQPCLLRFGWALSSDHAATDRIFVNDMVKMSNPCHAVTRSYALKLLERYQGIIHTVDVYQHALAVRPGESFTVFPPIASELSWTEGVFASTIHPKSTRSRYLKSIGDAEGAEHNDLLVRNHVKKKYFRSLLVVSHPRCGSGYAANLCRQFGLDVGHEKVGSDGISSWMFAVDAEWNPYALDTIARTRRAFAWKYLLMPVRDLRTAAASVMRDSACAPPSYKFRREHILRLLGLDLDELMTPLEKAVRSITSWYRIILEQRPDICFRIEDEHERLRTFLVDKDLCAASKRNLVVDTSPINADKPYKGVRYPKPRTELADWLALPAESQLEIEWYCHTFGYTSPLEEL